MPLLEKIQMTEISSSMDQLRDYLLKACLEEDFFAASKISHDQILRIIHSIEEEQYSQDNKQLISNIDKILDDIINEIYN